MRAMLGASLYAASLFALGCGGSAPPPAASAPEPVSETAKDPVETWSADTERPQLKEAEPSDNEPSSGAGNNEPQFTDNMSVDEAINAVPRGVDRRNIDPETLAKPLQNEALYESCKPGTARVKVRVAVWDGRAVGVDVTPAPKNDALATCIKGKIRELTWEKKVKSLNTIEYQF